jgi:uncharacterized membrane protein
MLTRHRISAGGVAKPMVNVLTEITIERPLDIVAAYAADPTNAPKWYVNIKSAEWVTAPPLCVGSHIRFRAEFLGKQLVYTYEISQFEPNALLVMRTADGPFPMETTYTWTSLNANQTRMTLRNKGNPSGFSKLLAPFMTMMMRRENGKDLKRIKELLESSL